MSRRVLAWLLVVAFLVCSWAAPAASSSRPLADSYDARKLTAAAGGGTAGRSPRGGRKPVWNRRSLGARTTTLSPPQSNKMRAAAMPAPPPPRV